MKLSHYGKLAFMAMIVWSVSFSSLSLANPTTEGKRLCNKPGCHQKGDKNAPEFMKKLGLTPEQQSQLKAQHQQFQEANKATFETMKSQHEQLKAYLQAGKKDSPEAQSLKEQLKQEHESLRQQREAMMQSVLTPTQMAQFNQMKQEWRAQHPKGKGYKSTSNTNMPSQGQ